ncbi:MAG: FG-GAP-like repeat-containing protein [Acidobacteriota bacterium]|nr:FG-GAP-like repeat-containing protein [Acidobacteriota bacterium]
MSTVSRKIVFAKLTVIAFAAILAVFGSLSFPPKYEKVSASAFGPSASHTNAPGEDNCTACHTSFPVNSGTGNISISGLPANYLPNQQIPVTVTVNQSDAVIFGFQLTAIDSQGRNVGTYTLPEQSPMQIQTIEGIVDSNQRRYVEHTSDGVIPTQFGTKSWTFIWNTPSRRVGKVSFYASGTAANSDGGPSGDNIYTTTKSTLSGTAISNFDNDGKSDIAVFRPTTGVWYSLNSSNENYQAIQFGLAEDKVVAGDYDGDGRSDFAVYRPSTGVWYVLRSSDNSVYIPQFGISTDKIAQGDYDADGKTDIAVYRPSTGIWYLLQSTQGVSIIQFGTDEDKPVPADFNGDGKTDIAVYRPSTGVWYFLQANGFTGIQFGLNTDKPAPADYDGDGKTDIAVYRPSTGVWYVLRSSDNSVYIAQFGNSEDIPVPSGFIAE